MVAKPRVMKGNLRFCTLFWFPVSDVQCGNVAWFDHLSVVVVVVVQIL